MAEGSIAKVDQEVQGWFAEGVEACSNRFEGCRRLVRSTLLHLVSLAALRASFSKITVGVNFS